MFGYIKPDQSELKVKEFELYKSVYCGLCRAMKKHTSSLSCATLSYDMVFLAVVRLALSGEEYSIKYGRCLPHPLKKRRRLLSGNALPYCAAASAVLVYYNLLDDINDSNKSIKKLGKRMLLPLSKSFRKKARLPKEYDEYIRGRLAILNKLESEKCPNISQVADIFGEILSYIFSFGLCGDKKEIAKAIGFSTGKWIYIADAVDDYESDLKKGDYNPFIFAYPDEKNAVITHKSEIIQALSLEREAMENAVNLIDFSKTAEFEQIIYNIIYCGMHNTAARIFMKKEEKKQ